MPDINDAAEYLAHHRTQKQYTMQVDDYLISIQNHEDYQQIFLCFSEDVQENLKQGQTLLDFLAQQKEIDTRFSLVYHPKYQFALQGFLPILPKNNQQDDDGVDAASTSTSTLNSNSNSTSISKITPPKTSFSAQAKNLLQADFLDSEDLPKDSKTAQKLFLKKDKEVAKPAEYENPLFNTLDAMMMQADFMMAHVLR